MAKGPHVSGPHTLRGRRMGSLCRFPQLQQRGRSAASPSERPAESPAFQVDETEARRIRQLHRLVGWCRHLSVASIGLLYGILWWRSGEHQSLTWLIVVALAVPYTALWFLGLERVQARDPWWFGWLSLAADVTLLCVGALLLAPYTAWIPLWSLTTFYYVVRWGRRLAYGVWIAAVAWLFLVSYWRPLQAPAGFPWFGEGILLIAMIILTVLMDRILEDDRRLRLQLGALAVRDGLTGLYNHRFFYEVIEREFSRARRQDLEISLLMIDIDHFKALNDSRGHLAGDGVLRTIAKVLGDCVRDHDAVFRYGGEEFAILLPGAGPLDAVRVADRVHAAVRNHPFPLGRVTVSVGWSSYPAFASNPADLVGQADTALYQAKRSGRDRVLGYRAR